MYLFLRLCGWFAAGLYVVSPFILSIRKSGEEHVIVFANPLWVLIAVVAFGLSHLVYRANQAVEILRQFDGWKSREGDRFSVKGPTLMELLQQLRDRLPPP